MPTADTFFSPHEGRGSLCSCGSRAFSDAADGACGEEKSEGVCLRAVADFAKWFREIFDKTTAARALAALTKSPADTTATATDTTSAAARIAAALPLLKLAGVRGGYTPERDILQGVELEIRRGECVGILGLNGSGKSSLGKAILNMLPRRTGTIEFEGRDISGLSTAELARRGIHIFMQGAAVFDNLTVRENLFLAASGDTARLHAFARDYAATFPEFVPAAKSSREADAASDDADNDNNSISEKHEVAKNARTAGGAGAAILAAGGLHGAGTAVAAHTVAIEVLVTVLAPVKATMHVVHNVGKYVHHLTRLQKVAKKKAASFVGTLGDVNVGQAFLPVSRDVGTKAACERKSAAEIVEAAKRTKTGFGWTAKYRAKRDEFHGCPTLNAAATAETSCLLARRADKLSGGQRHTLALAMALLHNPRLLVLDEPSAGLSPSAAKTLYDTLRTITANGDITILLIEQNVTLAQRFASRLLVTQQGVLKPSTLKPSTLSTNVSTQPPFSA